MGHGLKKAGGAVALIACLVDLAGCATIIHGGGSQDVGVASTPPGASAKFDSGIQTTTPGTVTLKRKQDYNVVFTKEGFPDRQAKIESTASWWLLGNALLGGVIGIVIDLVTGGGYRLTPENLDMDLGTGLLKN